MKILWDLNIQTNKVIDARHPDIVVTNKDKQEDQTIDIATEKEIEKRGIYQDLEMEIRRPRKKSVQVVPIVVGALRTNRNARSDLEVLGIKDVTEMIQTAVLLGSAHILRKTLCFKEQRNCSRIQLPTSKGRVNKKNNNNNDDDATTTAAAVVTNNDDDEEDDDDDNN